MRGSICAVNIDSSGSRPKTRSVRQRRSDTMSRAEVCATIDINSFLSRFFVKQRHSIVITTAILTFCDCIVNVNFLE
jgi:hypothetical protein